MCSRKNQADFKTPDPDDLPGKNFFRCCCEKTCGATKRLNLPGKIANRKLRSRRRLLQDADIPALLIFLKQNRDVRSLNLAYNSVTDAGFQNLLDHSILYKTLDELNVQNNEITKKGIDYLLELGKDLQIRSLRLRGNKFGVEASVNLARFMLKNRHILCLDAAEVDQTASSLVYFVKLLSSDQEFYNETLKILDISRPNPGCMYYFDSEHFASLIGRMLRNNVCLRELHLEKYNFSCHDVEVMMANAIYNNSLTLIDLGSNNIGDHGVDCLAKWLMKRPALRVLILCRNIVTDHGARALSFSLPFSRLLSLDISYNKITDEGFTAVLNSLKKSPLLRQLRVFGNRIGHQSGKIVVRMLLSKVLTQENIDIKPYRVDHVWYFARYPVASWETRYFDVPYTIFSKEPKLIAREIHSKESFKFIFSKSDVTVISQMLSRRHSKECKCCYCLKCEEPFYDEACRSVNHPDACTCCDCKPDDSLSELTFSSADSVDPALNIAPILERVNSKTRANILRWINMDEETLEEDLEAAKDPEDKEEISTDGNFSCNCSWIPLTLSMVLQYFDGVPLEDLIADDKTVTCCCSD